MRKTGSFINLNNSTEYSGNLMIEWDRMDGNSYLINQPILDHRT